ncbi:MAG: DNA-binding MarR family transcriptional regulator [Halieaceae bacterium]|jgi:DNA-binding MarR family transcriptional regulator
MSNFPKHELGQTLMLALSDFQRRLDADLAQRGIRGIRARHRRVFMHLERDGASRSVDLAEKIGVRPQSMMKTIHELESSGLVRRCADPSDSRAKLVEFTEEGQTLIDELTRSTETVWEQYAARAGQDELEQAVHLLRTLPSPKVEGVSHDG